MKRIALATLFFASTAFGQLSTQPVPVALVADDAKVVDRVAEVARRDLPTDLLRRLVSNDIEMLRGRRPDGTYQYAGYERLEAERSSIAQSVQPSANDELMTIEVKGAFIYRVILDVPSRRLVVTKNRPVWIERVEIEYMPQFSSVTKRQVVFFKAWVQPGSIKPIDVEEIARQATVRIFARSEKAKGYGNLSVTLIVAKVFDNPDSPYADSVASAKAIQRALDHNDITSIRAMAQRMIAHLQPAVPATRTIDVTAARPVEQPRAPAITSQVPSDVLAQLQDVEDMLTGSDAEKRQGVDKLHQIIRRLRSK